MKSIYDLKLHEHTYIDSTGIWVVRVPGGWIYNLQISVDEGTDTTVFVPYSTEFKPPSSYSGMSKRELHS